MVEVKFYDVVEDELLKFAVIISKTAGKWVFCKHRERDTFEVPGGHREIGESILETARRELREETFGMLYFADVLTFEEIHSEIEKIWITDTLPDNWTYPLIQPRLIEEAQKRGFLVR